MVHYETERLIPHLLRSEGVSVTVVDAPPAELLAWYGYLDLTICQMLHSSILSFNAGVPAVNLGYDIKNHAFFELMNQERCCLPANTTGSEELLAAAEWAIEEGDALQRRIAARKVELRRDLDEYLASVVHLVAGAQSAFPPQAVDGSL
jgi:polysaccharide pyruvyl transferase WcaK-like protein